MNIKNIISEIESTMKSTGVNYQEYREQTNRPKLKNTFCDDCQSFSIFMMLHDEIWNSISDGNPELFLCPRCMEKRVGRKITLSDLKICNVNYPFFFSEQFFENN